MAPVYGGDTLVILEMVIKNMPKTFYNVPAMLGVELQVNLSRVKGERLSV